MTKSEFMRELASLLSRIPEDERNDALQYYEDYFADAGIKEDMLVPSSIGTPQQVADKIIGEAVYGKSSQAPEELKDMPIKKDDSDNTKLILGIILILITFPVWSGVVMGIGGVLLGIFAALIGIIIGFGAAGIALMVTAFFASGPASGILLMGTGLLLLALAIICVIPLVMFCGQFLPWLVRGLVNLVKRLLGKKEYTS